MQAFFSTPLAAERVQRPHRQDVRLRFAGPVARVETHRAVEPEEIRVAGLGRVYMQTGQYELAIADYDKAITLKPDNGMPYNNRGFAFLLMGNLDAAEADIADSLKLNPDNIYALNSMAEIYAARNDAEEACNWLKRAIEKGYNNWHYIRTSKTYDHIRNAPCFRTLAEHRRQ